MKRILSITSIVLFAFIPIFKSYSQTIPGDSLYLSQALPGYTPERFNLSVSSGLFLAERIAISPDEKEIYYSELDNYPPSTMRIKYFRYSNNKWNGPFSLFDGYNAPGLTLSGDTMFVEKLHSGGSTPYSYISLRNDTAWTAPIKFMPNNQSYKHYLQITNSGNYYLSSNPPGSIGGLDWCRLVIDNTDTTIHTLGSLLNTSSNDADFFIARDESYIIFSSFPSSSRQCNGYIDLFITYKKTDGTWTNPKNLGTTINVINPSDGRWGPYVTSDNKYMFYSRGISPADGGINWVRIDNLIDSLRYTNFAPYIKNPISDQQATKDSMFNYQIPDSTFLDDDGNKTLTYNAMLINGKPLPAWLSFDSTSRTFFGSSSTLGAYGIKVIAKDTDNESVSCTFRITVANAPSEIGEEKNRLPQGFKLDQNYPNPFNPATTIHYTLAKASFVKLTIYNLLGQKIRTLQNVFQIAGEHSVVWYATDEKSNPVGSGMYFYRLETDRNIIQKKMVLVK